MSRIISIDEFRGVVSIGLDDADTLHLSKKHFRALSLRLGDEIDPVILTDRAAALQAEDAYEKALCCLDRASCSRRMLACKLLQAGYVAPAVDAVVERLSACAR